MAEAYLLVGKIFEEQKACKKATAVYRLFLDRAAKEHPERPRVKERVKVLRKDPACR